MNANELRKLLAKTLDRNGIRANAVEVSCAANDEVGIAFEGGVYIIGPHAGVRPGPEANHIIAALLRALLCEAKTQRTINVRWSKWTEKAAGEIEALRAENARLADGMRGFRAMCTLTESLRPGQGGGMSEDVAATLRRMAAELMG